MASKKTQSRGKKKIISIQVKKDIIEKHDRGMRVTDLASEYKMLTSTISTILKKKDVLKDIDVAKGVTILTKKRTPLIEEVEKRLPVWIIEKQLKGESISKSMICEKAKKLHSDLMERNPSGSAPQEEFKASRGWFHKFQKRSGIRSITKHGKAASSGHAAPEAFELDFVKFLKEEEYLPQQVFNCDETGLFWEKMPNRTFITQDEQKMPGHKPMKDRLTLLLCANTTDMMRHGEAANADYATAEAFKLDFVNFLKEEEYLPQQVLNCDETGLFWKKMPRRTYITQEEQKMPGHKPMKDRLTLLLCANATGDLKIKPLLVHHSQTPRPFHRENVNKATLPVMWRANARARMTRQLFLEWLYEVFAPTVKKYLSDNQLPERCLLLMDNTPAHPPSLVEDIDEDFIRVKFLPPKITPLLQPMDQQVISSFKKLYTKALFTRCFNITEETSLTLKEFWRSHFNVLHSVRLIDKAWQDVTTQTLNSAWRKLWPECVTNSGTEGTDAQLVRDIVSMGEGMGLDVSEEDVEELIEEHKEELTTEELAELQTEQRKALVEEFSTQEEALRVSSEEIRSICMKWNECQDFFEKHHPNRTVTGRALDMMNDKVVRHFRKVLQHRANQVTWDSFFTRMEPAGKRQRQETPGEDDPEEGSSTSPR
nr:tigger transposable element-derived protein 1-like [Pogona vitticeps]XP_020670661.1 tigger transposable element-derived protein 1-like [Pogona vitticeps]XP_020670663.1 tigger transposable element-derived protein 1-like [Pogona vitticeps]